ncbi:hypothetical protein [Kitasatospora sp. NPDC088351]|uniref:hypothetical protein n=1 Tax=Kitasatospora sp. NPDC088351 TaxID=3155180 RepID=UPI00343D1059
MTDTTRPEPDPAAALVRLELFAYRSRPVPACRDLGRAVLDSPLVRGSMWLRWSGHDGIRTLHHGAGLARGWTERDVDGLDGWVAQVDGRIVHSVRPGSLPEPVVHAEEWEAGATLHAALAQHPNRTDHAQDEPDDQKHALLGDIPARVRRRAAGMTLENIQQALHRARDDERTADRYADAGDETGIATAAAIRAEWQRVRDHTAETRAERYDPDHDTALRHALRRERHRRDVADRSAEAEYLAMQRADVAHRRVAGTAAQPLYTALGCAGLYVLTDADHEAVRDLTRDLDPATPQADAPTAPAEAPPGRRQRLLAGADAVTAATMALADALDQGDDPDRTAAALRLLLAAAAELTDRATGEVGPVAGATKPQPADGGQPAFPEPRNEDFRRGNETPPVPRVPAAPAFRGGNETPPAASGPVPAPARPAPAFTVAHPDDSDLQPDAVLRATSDPVRRFGPPDRSDDLALTFGPGWTTSSWSTPQAAGVHQLHHRGVRVGWAALLGDGPWGLGGWIGVLHLADGRAEPLLGGLGRPRTHRDWSEALDALRSARVTPPATAARTPDAARPAPRTSGWTGPRAAEPGLVTVPRDPVLRGMPDNDAHRELDPAVFGDYWKLLGWTVQPGVWLVTAEGHAVGWVERGVAGSKQWVAVYEGYFLGDSLTQEPILHDTPEQAAHTVMKAYLEQV